MTGDAKNSLGARLVLIMRGLLYVTSTLRLNYTCGTRNASSWVAQRLALCVQTDSQVSSVVHLGRKKETFQSRHILYFIRWNVAIWKNEPHSTCIDLGSVAKRWKTCDACKFDFDVNARFQLGSACESVHSALSLRSKKVRETGFSLFCLREKWRESHPPHSFFGSRTIFRAGKTPKPTETLVTQATQRLTLTNTIWQLARLLQCYNEKNIDFIFFRLKARLCYRSAGCLLRLYC